MIYVPSEWMGVCSYDGGQEDFPFKMHVASLKGKDITGTITWPTLGNAKTKIRGKIEGNNFSFEEYEAIFNGDEVQIPSYYSGLISAGGKVIKGKTVGEAGSDDEDDATFQLDLVEEEESSADEPLIPKITADAKFEGKYFTESPFTLKISKRKGDLVEGTISWKHQQCKTKFKGTVTAQGLKFEEYEVISQEDDKKSSPRAYHLHRNFLFRFRVQGRRTIWTRNE
eukprot:TRINITY_DN4196_c1_g1_i5.p1 TRINITY_DN4196_c1_g1~~TRINITY_DN4196_c1_g1_i5.p1  ORF type:complete len:226 (-),score=71.65 TRINITY_DN4196_c1_g1_i5:90-767(-)